MAYTTAEGREQVLGDLAVAIEQIAESLAALGEAYEQLDEHTADVLEEQLFRPVQSAYGRARRTYREFASRSNLRGRTFDAHSPGLQSQTVQALIERAVDAAHDADQSIAELQDSMLPVEVGDPELRAGLSQVRETLSSVPLRAADARAHRSDAERPSRRPAPREEGSGCAALLALALHWPGVAAARPRPLSSPTAASSRSMPRACAPARRSRLLDRHGRTVRDPGRPTPRAGSSSGRWLPAGATACAPGRVRRIAVTADRVTGRDAPPSTTAATPSGCRPAATDTCARATGPGWRSTSACRPGRARTRRSWSTRATATPIPPGPESGISPIANLLGFAVVDVNMRGTGCSGGAYDYFERLQSLDGYDVIETVARQPWVLGHRVGMMGISYGGISQLFVAATDPPHLAAITPLSVIDSTVTTLYPGGILNTGFALNWGEERAHDALPASPHGGQPWALKRIRGGDRTCRRQPGAARRGAEPDRQDPPQQPLRPGRRRPAGSRSPSCTRSALPTYLACQWADEQTGGHCADLAAASDGHAARVVHVHQRRPHRLAGPGDVQSLVRLPRALRRPSPAVAVGRDPSARAPRVPDGDGDLRRHAAARSDPVEPVLRGGARRLRSGLAPIRVLFDNGAGSAGAGRPVCRASSTRSRVSRSPAPERRSWYLSAGGGLAATSAGAVGADRFTWRPGARPATNFTGDRTTATRAACGRPPRATTGIRTRRDAPPPTSTAPLTANTAVIGGGAVHLWIKASAPSVDLQATVSEVRPDGKETFVQSGWLRADERELDLAHSTLLEPVPSLRAADVAPAAAGSLHRGDGAAVLRGSRLPRGSRIRLTVSAPGGDQPVWAFCRDQAASGRPR